MTDDEWLENERLEIARLRAKSDQAVVIVAAMFLLVVVAMLVLTPVVTLVMS